MKKILFVSILISTSALALGIDINTKIKWNSIVVVAAAHDVGLNAEYDTHTEVSSTYYRILGDLLERDKFSVADAVSVCNQECNKSAFLREGRGQSGKKCPEICKSFGNALIEENNKKTYALQLDDEGYVYDSRGRIYTHDKEFYADETETMYSGKETVLEMMRRVIQPYLKQKQTKKLLYALVHGVKMEHRRNLFLLLMPSIKIIPLHLVVAGTGFGTKAHLVRYM